MKSLGLGSRDSGRGPQDGQPVPSPVDQPVLVVAPEMLAAVRNASRGRVQTSVNLALGSAIASIGLTIPAIAIASIWLEGPLMLGLDSTPIVWFAVTVLIGRLTVLSGRATVQEDGVHLVLFASVVFLALNP